MLLWKEFNAIPKLKESLGPKDFVPIIFGLIGVGILASLGFWQIQRLTWKEDLLSRIEMRINRPSVALPLEPTENDDQYLKVAVEGIFLPGEISEWASTLWVGIFHLFKISFSKSSKLIINFSPNGENPSLDNSIPME